eukprot:CAMPEP_0176079494 /NCGR_PEP_ID=MMETSP0120_2-20121206/39760_1 /TAXON_ID=160619 /ORGANISM="Kryptoperidinium foliaceum, Strain CCMP 1326" /LENGTH=136 /DNA_ID=CAMNT_0017413253 /DNA_START=30 /DNA_END=441 /DNA_ORIENTATION=+
MSADMQARANALNAKMEGEAAKVMDDIERNMLRKVARESFACAVKCYDKAGTSGSSEALDSLLETAKSPTSKPLHWFKMRLDVFLMITGGWTVSESVEQEHAGMPGEGPGYDFAWNAVSAKERGGNFDQVHDPASR